MKPSHYTTPRNLAECTYEVGYRSVNVSNNISLADAVWLGLLGISVFAGVLACMLAYFDVLVP